MCGDLESDIELDPLDIVLSVDWGQAEWKRRFFWDAFLRVRSPGESGVMVNSGIAHVFHGHRARDCAARWS